MVLLWRSNAIKRINETIAQSANRNHSCWNWNWNSASGPKMKINMERNCRSRSGGTAALWGNGRTQATPKRAKLKNWQCFTGKLFQNDLGSVVQEKFHSNHHCSTTQNTPGSFQSAIEKSNFCCFVLNTWERKDETPGKGTRQHETSRVGGKFPDATPWHFLLKHKFPRFSRTRARHNQNRILARVEFKGESHITAADEVS